MINYSNDSPTLDIRVGPHEHHLEVCQLIDIRDDFQATEKIAISSLVPYSMHPFKNYSTDALTALANDIKNNGLYNPIIIRNISLDYSEYEILSGHSRVEAYKLLGLDKIEAWVCSINDIKAVEIVTKSNILQRDKIYPSEISKSLNLRNEILKEQRKIERARLENPDNINEICKSHDGTEQVINGILQQEFNKKKSRVFRYIRLVQLIPELLVLVDDSKINLNLGSELSYLFEKHQAVIYELFYKENRATLDITIAKDIREFAKTGGITFGSIEHILKKYKKDKRVGVKDFQPIIKKWSTKFNSGEEMAKLIDKFLEQHFKER